MRIFWNNGAFNDFNHKLVDCPLYGTLGFYNFDGSKKVLILWNNITRIYED